MFREGIVCDRGGRGHSPQTLIAMLKRFIAICANDSVEKLTENGLRIARPSGCRVPLKSCPHIVTLVLADKRENSKLWGSQYSANLPHLAV